MPERNLFHLKEHLLQKYKKELCGKVKFSDVSHTLLVSGSLTKDDCFEICSLPSSQQMNLCYEKLLQQFILSGQSQRSDGKEVERSSHNDIWTILLRALTVDHPGLTCKLDSDLQKLSKKEKPKRLTKDDIGLPMNFKHLQHIGQSPFRRFLSLRSTSSTASSSFDENDPDVKSFLTKAGVTDRHLKIPKARNFIFDFIEKSGGIEAIRREVRSTSADSCSSEAMTSSPSSVPSPTCVENEPIDDSSTEVKLMHTNPASDHTHKNNSTSSEA